MANLDQKGFYPVEGSGRPIRTREVLWEHTSATACHAGSFVKQLAGTDEWVIAAAGDAIDSLVLGWRYIGADGKEVRSVWLPTGAGAYTYPTGGQSPKPTTGTYATIVDDAFNARFIGQLDGALTDAPKAETLNFDLVQTAADTAATSGQEINASSGATSSAQLRGVEYYKPLPKDAAYGNDTTLTHAKLVVRINESESDPAQTTTAVGTAA